jgi:hypothetical protein
VCNGVDQVNNDFVRRCAASFKAANSGIDTEVVLVEKASKTTWNRRRTRIRPATRRRKRSGPSGNHGREKMYDPLASAKSQNQCVDL